MKHRIGILLTVSSLLVLFAGLSAKADWATGWGCFDCRPHDFGLASDDKCWQVGDKQHGLGIQCENPYFFGAHICNVSGGPCYNTIATPGGSTGGGGGSGGGFGGGTPGCTVSGWGLSCPLTCNSCYTPPLT